MRVVTTNNVEIFRHLGSLAFVRLAIDHHLATTAEEALALIRDKRPAIAILETELPGLSGYDVCRAVKADAALAQVRVMLVLGSVIGRRELELITTSGCDDVLAPPFHGDELYRHIAQIAGLPLRRNRRVHAALEIELPGAGTPLVAQVENLSFTGAGIRVREALAPGAALSARLIHAGTTFSALEAQVAWVKPGPDGESSVGLSFVKTPPNVLALLEELCLFEITTLPDGTLDVCLQGEFTERSNFALLTERLHSATRIEFDGAAVRYISSAGVRAWCEFLATLAGKQYVFRHCSVALVLQAAMVPLAVGTGVITSLEVPYLCPACDREDLRLLDTSALARDGDQVVPPAFHCTTCGGALVFDDVPARYFAFLRPRR